MRRLFTLGLGVLAGLAMTGGGAAASEDRPLPVQMIFEFNNSTILLVATVCVLVYVGIRLMTRNLSKEKPGRCQVFLELIVSAFGGLVKQSIGPNRGPQFLPYIGTLFFFLWVSNLLSLAPVPTFTLGGEAFSDYNGNGFYDAGEPFTDANGNGIHDAGWWYPGFSEPTADLNVPLGLALLFVTWFAQGYAIRYHGLWGYIKSYFSPGGVIGLVMFPLNVVGKIAEHVSISFRLFGNLFGGAVIMSVVAGMLFYLVIPIPMFAYFGAFAGTIQAFVYTMLAMTYISMEIAEE